MKIISVLLFAILACDQIVNSYRILGVFPMHGKSHWFMMEQLMKNLAKRGHQVDVVTHFPQKKPIPNYTDISIEGSVPLVVNNMTATDIKRFSFLSLHYLSYMAGTVPCELLSHPKIQDLIKNPPQDPPYDIFITELFVSPCYLAFGRHLKIPTIGLVSSVLLDWLNEGAGNPDNPAFIPSLFSTSSQDMNFIERVKNVLMTNIITTQIHYYTNSQVQLIKKYFGMDVPHIKDLYKEIALFLVNSHHSLNGIRPMTTAVVEVGGLHIPENDYEQLLPEVQKWLDESKDGCIYFTFGSMVRIETFPKELLKIFYASFKKIAPVRVLMKVAKKEELLPGLPENVMTQPWFTQILILKHKNTRAFITHGGLLGTQESINFGVPMIGIPLFGDQGINIQNYVQKKLAISLNSVEDITEEKLDAALNTILNDPSYLNNTRRISKLFRDRPMSAIDTSIYWVEYVARYGKKLQSPAVRLNWWQQNSFDVYAFLLAIVIIVACVVLYVLRKLKKFLCRLRGCAANDSTAMKLKNQ